MATTQTPPKRNQTYRLPQPATAKFAASPELDSSIASAHSMSRDAVIPRKGAARMMGLSVHTLAHWASTKKENLPYIKLSTRVMYRVGDILDFIESNRVVPSTD